MTDLEKLALLMLVGAPELAGAGEEAGAADIDICEQPDIDVFVDGQPDIDALGGRR